MFDDYLKEYEGDDLFLFKSLDPINNSELSRKEPASAKKTGSRGRPRGERSPAGKKNEMKIVNMNKRTGHWSHEEKKKYHWFLEIHHHHFINKHLRRSDKIFKTMESFLGTRQAEQCRSHHQKMEKKFKYFERILIHLRNVYYGTLDSAAIAE